MSKTLNGIFIGIALTFVAAHYFDGKPTLRQKKLHQMTKDELESHMDMLVTHNKFEAAAEVRDLLRSKYKS